jgi:hypothetical protein
MPYFKDFMKFLFVYFPISSTTADPKVSLTPCTYSLPTNTHYLSHVYLHTILTPVKQIIERIIAINVSICSVFSHFINEENKEEEWIDTLIEYIADVFNGKVHSLDMHCVCNCG